jgi:hypothetical protein
MKSSRLSSIILSAVCALALAGQKASAISTNIVIAEIYGGGGNSGANYSHDYIVLFNKSAAAVDVNGWSVQYASATGPSTGSWASGPIANTSTLIPAGGYFLVKMASGGANGASIGTPDGLTNNINMSASAGKVALCNVTNALTTTTPSSPTIVDLVGFGTTANFSETANAPALTTTTSLLRKDGGCFDSDNNSADFITGAPTLRNSSSSLQVCGGATTPVINTQPTSRTNNAGTSTTFSLSVTGSGLFYQWIKDGANITEGNAPNTTGQTLTITNLVAANAGNYQVIITNSAGGTTSAVATLTVIDPAINTQPVNRTNVLGDTANFFVSAGGTALTYQWTKDGTNISAGTAATLNVTNVQSSDVGSYRVIVSNGGLSVTSSVATLTLISTPSTRLARWGFNGNLKSATSPVPSETVESASAASASLVGGATATFAGGTFSDPAQANGEINDGWGSSGYPAASANNKTAGVQFNVSTEGYKNIFITWEQRNSSTGSKYARLQYSPDGFTATTNDASVFTMPTDSVFIVYSADLSGITSINNNPNFAYRIVAEFESTATGAGAAAYLGTTGSYGSGGTMRYDIMSIYGNTLATVTPVPLTAVRSGNNINLTWSDSKFILQSASSITGPFNDVVGAVSGYSAPIAGAQQYFRLVAHVP